MSSTFLTRLRIGERLVDAKGVSRLYNPDPASAPSPCSSGSLRSCSSSWSSHRRPSTTWRSWSGSRSRSRSASKRWNPRTRLARRDHLAFPREWVTARATTRHPSSRFSLPWDRDPGRRRVSRRCAYADPQEPGAEPHWKPSRRPSARRSAERRTRHAKRVRQPGLPGARAQPLRGKTLGLVAFGGLPAMLRRRRGALAPTGGRLVGVGVMREPVDLRGLAGDLSADAFRRSGSTTSTPRPRWGWESAASSSSAAPWSSGSGALLLAGQRQLRRAGRTDRRPQRAADMGPCSAATRDAWSPR